MNQQPDFYRSCDIMEFYDESDSEGLRLRRLFNANKVKGVYARPRSNEGVDAFWHRITTDVFLRNRSARAANEPLYAPELHISCHGSPEGVMWIDNTLVTWGELRDLLWYYSSWLDYVSSPANNGAFSETTSCISLSLSCCYGGHAARDFYMSQPFPVGGFAAPSDEIWMDDAAWFFCSYHYRGQTDHPWNMPDLIAQLSEERQLKGPGGPVFIEHYTAPLTPNPQWKAKYTAEQGGQPDAFGAGYL